MKDLYGILQKQLGLYYRLGKRLFFSTFVFLYIYGDYLINE